MNFKPGDTTRVTKVYGIDNGLIEFGDAYSVKDVTETGIFIIARHGSFFLFQDQIEPVCGWNGSVMKVLRDG